MADQMLTALGFMGKISCRDLETMEIVVPFLPNLCSKNYRPAQAALTSRKGGQVGGSASQ